MPLVLLLTVAGCVSREDQIAGGKQNYLAARDACVTAYPSRLVSQSECRTRAADQYIRPWYKYPDLMTELQDRRRELAVKADAHQITRAEYDRQVARAERDSDREEARRNRAATVVSAHDGDPAGR
jgi:hypothetical protein